MRNTRFERMFHIIIIKEKKIIISIYDLKLFSNNIKIDFINLDIPKSLGDILLSLSEKPLRLVTSEREKI